MKLRVWFHAILLMVHSKKGISALQIHRMLGTGSYETAWYMCHRIRAAMNAGAFRLHSGVVEIDETYIGGKPRNRHDLSRKPKTAIIGAVERKVNVIAKVINDTTNEAMHAFVKRTVGERVSLVATDEHRAYKSLKRMGYKHRSVNHSRGEYVRGLVHTANLDSFWSLLKRGIVGAFHNVSKEYLPLYLNEFAFRHNSREHGDIFGRVVRGC
ncbi:MAG: IS1595 family transposase [Candidatus Binatia bacterium]